MSKLYFEVYENRLTVVTETLTSPLSLLALTPLAVKFTEFTYECYFKLIFSVADHNRFLVLLCDLGKVTFTQKVHTFGSGLISVRDGTSCFRRLESLK